MRKKLFAVIMSAMMMITFMPSMAFAADSVTVDYKEKEVTNWYNFDKADVLFVNSADATDTYTSNFGTNRIASSSFAGMVKAAVIGYTTLTKDYYDLDYAKVSKLNSIDIGGGTLTFEGAQQIFGTNIDKTVDVDELTLSVPTYVLDYNTITTSTAKVGDQTWKGKPAHMTFKVAAPAYNFEEKYEKDQTFEIALIPDFDVSANGTFIGMVKPVKLTIKKAKADVTKFDETNYVFKDKFNGIYDGAEHTLEQVSVSGITSTFELYNTKTGKYEPVDSVKVKNAGKYNIKATAKDSKGNTKTTYITKEVKPSCGIVINFKKSSEDKPIEVAGGFEPENYLTVTYEISAGASGDATANAEAKLNAKAAKKAIAADKKELLEFAKEDYAITLEDNVAIISENDSLTYAEQQAILTKYADVRGNYTKITLGDDVTAYFKVIDDITFTKAPLNKVYKAKKGKLAKKKTFMIKAKAASGSQLVYKVKNGASRITINRKTGKVTVKKGLKKGTYKIGVYAITLKSFDRGNENWIEDHYTLKVKIK